MLPSILGLSLTSAILIATPGPSILFLVARALTHGRASALQGVVGNALGFLTVGFVVAAGLGTLITRFESLAAGLRVFGACVLIGLSVVYARQALGEGHANESAERRRLASKRGDHNPLALGFLIAVTNPKALVIFGSIVPAFLPPSSTSPVVLQLILLSLVPVLVGLVIDVAWVEAAGQVKARLGQSDVTLRAVYATGALLMTVLAVLLVVSLF